MAVQLDICFFREAFKKRTRETFILGPSRKCFPWESHFPLAKIQRKFGKTLFFVFLPFQVFLNEFEALGLITFSRHPYTIYKCLSSVIADI